MIFGRLFGRGRHGGGGWRGKHAPPAQASLTAGEPEPEISPARLDAALERLRAEAPEPPAAETDDESGH
jgi:hypothetical protein